MQDKYLISQREKELQEFWNSNGVTDFKPGDNNAPIYSIDTPPPTVSGKIHIGHIFSYTQAEVVARFKRMVGNVLFYPLGFDDNGLPTEKLVEKEIGKKGSELSREEFTQECLRVTGEYREKFQKLWQSMGFSVDWKLSYSTISPEVQEVSQKSFVDLLNKGVIYQKESPCLWCPECQTVIAQADVEKKELKSVFYDIEFNLEDNKPLVISTTRPELLSACLAVFVNSKDDRYLDLIGKNVTTPFGNTVKILADDKVDKNKGSGAVMCCSYGDETDMYWVKKHCLDEKIILDKSGTIINTGDIELDGLYYKKARKKVVQKLTEKSKIISLEDIKHDVGTHERCGTPIEILNMKQWFIKTIDIKDKLIENGNRIKWNPKHMQKRYIEWVENLKWDWCISRQRFFGIPIPVWYSKKTGEVILPDQSQLPINPLVDFPNNLPEGHTNADIYPEQDVLDTWATSSLTPLVNSKFFSDNNLNNLILPMSLRPQAHDIIRTWALYTIIMSYYHTGDIPFENLMISGHVLAPKGDKISKSKDNAGTSPEELIKKYGADPIRYWACGGTFGKDIAFEEKEIEKGRKLVTKLWNAAKFAIGNLKDYDSKEILKKSDLDDIDRWIVEKSVLVGEKMKNSLESFNIGLAVSEFEKFFWSDFCDNYIEIVKGKINNSNKETNGEKTKKSSQYGLYKSLLNILKIIAPVLPHITEEIYKDFYEKTEGKISIHNCDYTNLIDGETNFDFDNCGVDKLFDIICLIRKHKTDNSIKYGQESNEIKIYCNDIDKNGLSPFIKEIKAISNSKNVTFVKSDEEVKKVEIIL